MRTKKIRPIVFLMAHRPNLAKTSMSVFGKDEKQLSQIEKDYLRKNSGWQERRKN